MLAVNDISAENDAFIHKVCRGLEVLMGREEINVSELHAYIKRGFQHGLVVWKKKDEWMGMFGLTHNYFNDATPMQLIYLQNKTIRYAHEGSEEIVEFTIFEVLMLFLGAKNYIFSV